MALNDFIKKTAGLITNPIGSAVNAAKSFGAALGSAASAKQNPIPAVTPAPQPAQQAQQTNGVYGPNPVVTATPVRNSPLLPTPSYTPQQVNQAAQGARFTDTMAVSPATTVSAAALSPDNTMSGLLSKRKELEQKYLKSFEPNDNLTKLAGIRNEIADVTEEYDRRIDTLEKNPNGVFGQGVLGTQLTKLRGEKNKELGYLALREATAQGIIDATEKERTSMLTAIEKIGELENKDLVGSLQQDDVTGEWSGFFRDPSTGQISQQIVGKTTPKMELTYQKLSDGTTVALDSKGNIVKQYGGGTGDPVAFTQDLQAFAQQYAEDGSKPTNIPEGMTFGQIAAAAANLPKSDGQLVSNSTNVTPTGMGVERKNAVSALYDIYQKADELAELDKKRGLDGSFLFNTEDKTRYMSLRNEITDLIARARTGAAITEYEEKRYEKQLPGAFKEEFLGKNSEDMIESFKENIKGALDNNLGLFNSSIYGYSKTNFQGQEVPVGTRVELNGMTGFVGPDGKLYGGEQPTQQTSFNSPGSGNLPQRNNNPGNVKAGGLADNYAVGTDEQGHLIFPDAETGFRAFAEDIQAKVNGNSRHLPPNPTLQQLGSVYAEDPNWPFAVARILNVPVGTPTQQIPMDQLVQAIARQEGFYA